MDKLSTKELDAYYDIVYEILENSSSRKECVESLSKLSGYSVLELNEKFDKLISLYHKE